MVVDVGSGIFVGVGVGELVGVGDTVKVGVVFGHQKLPVGG